MTPTAGDLQGPRPLRVFLLTLLLLAPLTHDRVFLGGNDASRFAQIEALVDHGETSIDASRYAWTTDRVVLHGRSYSNKPPLLAVAGAGLYVLLRAAGLSFADDEHAVVYLLTLLLVGVPTAWLVSRFSVVLAEAYPDRLWVRRWSVLALASATILTSFSGTLNSHTVAAALLFAAWTAALGRRPVMAGAWVALAAAVDLVPGLVFLPAIAYVAWQRAGRGGLIRAAAAVALVAVMAAGLDLWILGSPLPPLFVPGAVDQSGGKDQTGVMANIPMGGGPGGAVASLGAALFGSHGFFSMSPILLLGVAGLIAAAVRGVGPPFLPRCGTFLPQCGARVSRRVIAVAGTACAVLTVGHATLVSSFGGWSYGYRYLIPLVPFLLFFAPAAVPERRSALMAAMVAVSIPLALLGAYNPWPPVWEPETAGQGLEGITSPAGVNLAAWLSLQAPDWTVTERVATRFISPDQRVRNRYLYFFHRSKGDDEQALEAYRHSLHREPRQAVTHFDYAEALAALEDLEAAARHYSLAIELAPGFTDARRALSSTLAEIEQRRAGRRR